MIKAAFKTDKDPSVVNLKADAMCVVELQTKGVRVNIFGEMVGEDVLNILKAIIHTAESGFEHPDAVIALKQGLMNYLKEDTHGHQNHH